MNKDEMVNILSQRTGFMKKDSEVMLDAVFQIITEALAAGDKVQIANFGTFEVKHRAPRTGRDNNGSSRASRTEGRNSHSGNSHSGTGRRK